MEESYTPNTKDFYPAEQLELKDMNTEALYASLVEVARDWSVDQQRQLAFAYDLVTKAHANDRHKDRPYTEHLLRVANRLAYYLEVKDPDVIIAGMLHDIVEDHPLEIIDGSLMTEDRTPLQGMEDMSALSAKDQQMLALHHIEMLFSSKVSMIVASVTNAPPHDGGSDSYEQKLRVYVDKVTQAIQLPEAWLVKFADWCDNGLGINHDIAGQGNKRGHFIRKYGSVLPVLKARSEEEDVQALLSDKAKMYVMRQFKLGEERLLPEAAR